MSLNQLAAGDGGNEEDAINLLRYQPSNTHTSFALCPREYPLPSASFGTTSTFSIPLDGDLIARAYLLVQLPPITGVQQPVPKLSGPSQRPTLLPGASVQSNDTQQPALSVSVLRDWTHYRVAHLLDTLLAYEWTGLPSEFTGEAIRYIVNYVRKTTQDPIKSSILQRIVEIYATTDGIRSVDNISLGFLAIFAAFYLPIIQLSKLIVSLESPTRLNTASELTQNWIVSVFGNPDEIDLFAYYRKIVASDEFAKIIEEYSILVPTDPATQKINPDEYRNYLLIRLAELGYPDSESLFLQSQALLTLQAISEFYSSFFSPTFVRVLYEEATQETRTQQATLYHLKECLEKLVGTTQEFHRRSRVREFFDTSPTTQAFQMAITSYFQNIVMQGVVDMCYTTTTIITMTLQDPIQALSSYPVTYQEYCDIFDQIILANEAEFVSSLPSGIPSPSSAIDIETRPEFDINELIKYRLFGEWPTYPPTLPPILDDDIPENPIPSFRESLPLGYTLTVDHIVKIVHSFALNRLRDNAPLSDLFGTLMKTIDTQILLDDISTDLGYTVDPSTPLDVYSTEEAWTIVKNFINTTLIALFSAWDNYVSDLNGFVDDAIDTSIDITEARTQFIQSITRSITDYLITRNLNNLSLLTPDEIKTVFKAYGLDEPLSQPTNDFETYQKKQAMFSESFLEEMYCEYVYTQLFQLLPEAASYLKQLRKKLSSWDVPTPSYDAQVLLSYHFEDMKEVQSRSASIADLLTDDPPAILPAYYEDVLRYQIMTLSEYTEYVRTNVQETDRLFKEWQARSFQKKKKKDWNIVFPTTTILPATLIEEHYLRLATEKIQASFGSVEEYRDALLICETTPIPIEVGDGEVVAGFGYGSHDDVDLDDTHVLMLPGVVFAYPLPYFFGGARVIVWDGDGIAPAVGACRSIKILPLECAPTNELRAYKNINMIQDYDDNVMVAPDVIVVDLGEFARASFPPHPIYLKYETKRWELLGRNTTPSQSSNVIAREVSTPGWVEDVGLHIIQEASLMVGTQVIETITPASMSLQHCMLEKRKNIERGYTKMTSDVGNTLFIPLSFYFSRDYHTAFPLVACAYAEPSIKISLAGTGSLLLPFTRTPTQLSCRMMLDFVYLDEEERRRMVTLRHMFVSLVSRSVRYTNVSSDMRISLSSPTADIFVFFVRKGGPESPTSAVGVIETVSLVLEGREDDSVRDASFFSLVTQWASYPGRGHPYVYVFNFCLYPDHVQPSGSINMDDISDVRFRFTFKPQTDVDELDMVVVSRHYVFLQVASGFMGLAYA